MLGKDQGLNFLELHMNLPYNYTMIHFKELHHCIKFQSPTINSLMFHKCALGWGVAKKCNLDYRKGGVVHGDQPWLRQVLTFNSFSRLPKLRSRKYCFAKSQHSLNPNWAGMDLQRIPTFCTIWWGGGGGKLNISGKKRKSLMFFLSSYLLFTQHEPCIKSGSW